MENGGLSASDVALMTRHDGYGDMWGGNSMMWIFALLIEFLFLKELLKSFANHFYEIRIVLPFPQQLFHKN